MFPTENYHRVGPQKPLDGYGLPFDPRTHLDHVRSGIARLTKPGPPVPVVEPVWRDRPAGFRTCPPIFEDHEQGKGQYA